MRDGIDDHDEVAGLLGAYSLHATNASEAAHIEDHLRACPRCRTEVDGFREVAAAMGNSVEPVSAALWDRIALRMSERNESVPDPPDVPDPSFVWLRSVAPGKAHDGPPARDTGDSAPIVDMDGGRRRAGAAMAGVAAAAIAILSITLAQSDHRANQLQSALSSTGDSVEVAAALTNPAHETVRMRSANGDQVAQVVVVPGGRGFVTTSAMPSLPKDETYQLWAVIDGQPISVGILGNQVSTAAFTVGGSASPSQLWITVEPSGGVVTPDRTPVATGTVA